MAKGKYDTKECALELGFSKESAERFAAVNANATNLRRLAEAKRAKGLMPDQIAERAADAEAARLAKAEGSETVHLTDEELSAGVSVEDEKPDVPAVPKHKHYYRKDGTCACGVVRKAK